VVVSELQHCHACDRFDRETGVCHGNEQPVHENVYRLGCPDEKFPARGVAVLVTHQRTTLAEPPAEGQVLEDRRAVCEACPIGSFEGWADTGRTVAKCRECEGCRRRGRPVGLIAVTVQRCPRGHHEE
jgi:hypothetical protein